MLKHRTPDIMSSLANTAAMTVTKTVERINMAVPLRKGIGAIAVLKMKYSYSMIL